ncbi:CLUMA_CG013320, isoform A [Clunio marinus]|uniref:CLUMA_CG013320, isoform A n=1 Tax=Clunio marinus TaxID=568069 RepID=A0A1J1IIL6_9DIPT|nr:CLUMA_CG013320, isoform A [Clunio marinus]
MNFEKLLISTLVVLFSSKTWGSRVLELSDRFLDVRSEGMWYIEFYAPYCGYCKKLEPIWNHVGQSLHNTNIRVGKIDCTRFKSVCHSFKVQGYPTIIFIRGNNEYVFNGERTKDELVHFAMRMSGPPIQQVTRVESFEILKANNPIFFVYVGKQSGSLWDSFYINAEAHQAHGYFYATTEEVAGKHFFIDSSPVILVYKENSHYTFPLSDSFESFELSHLNGTLHNWITCERFPTFPKITRENIYLLRQTKKFLALVVVEENKLNELMTHELEFRDMIERIIRTKRSKYHEFFQFGWTNPELSHSIAMDTLSTPHLLILNSTTNEHHLPEDDPLEMTPEAVEIFLESVLNQSARVYGGDFFTIRMYRAWFELKRLLWDMWRGNPVLTCVIFGLPLGFLSLICYSIFCADIMDADEEEDVHEKKE